MSTLIINSVRLINMENTFVLYVEKKLVHLWKTSEKMDYVESMRKCLRMDFSFKMIKVSS